MILNAYFPSEEPQVKIKHRPLDSCPTLYIVFLRISSSYMIIPLDALALDLGVAATTMME